MFEIAVYFTLQKFGPYILINQFLGKSHGKSLLTVSMNRPFVVHSLPIRHTPRRYNIFCNLLKHLKLAM